MMGTQAGRLFPGAGVMQRRGVLAGAAALIGAGLAKLGTPERTEASHIFSDSSFIHASVENTPLGSTLINSAPINAPVLSVRRGPSGSVYPLNDGLQAATNGGAGSAGVRGIAEDTQGRAFGVHGETRSGHEESAGVLGEAYRGVTAAVRGRNESDADNARGVYGQSPAGVGTVGASGANVGVFGASTSHIGIVGQSTNSLGILGASASSIGIMGTSNTAIAMQAQTTTGVGLFAKALNPAGGGRAAVFDGGVTVVGPFTVMGGAKSAGVKHPDGTYRRMYCQEAPEPWFEDVGESKLASGRAEVKLDPEFAAVVKSDGDHVFLTEYADLGGLYVVSRSSGGFEVRSRTATASGSLGYRVMARRLDQVGKRMEQVDARPVPLADLKIPEVRVPKAPSV